MLVAGAAVVGVLLGLVMLQSIDAGESWEDWRDAVGGGWFTATQYGLIALFVAGFVVQGEAGAILVAVPAGACAVFFTFGLRRWLRRDRSVPQPVYEEPAPDRPLWQRTGLTLAWSVPLGVVMGVLLLDGTGEIVGMVVVVAFAALFYEFVMPVVERWFARRGL